MLLVLSFEILKRAIIRTKANHQMCVQLTTMFKGAFSSKAVLGTLEENDEEGDPGDADVLDDALGDVQGLESVAVDLGSLSI